MKISILGEEYKISLLTEGEDPLLINRNGYIDHTTKKIVIGIVEKNDESLGDLPRLIEKTLLHEIIHGFMFESGLDVGANNVHTEENVDWMAWQIEKIFNAFKSVKEELDHKMCKIYNVEEKINEKM